MTEPFVWPEEPDAEVLEEVYVFDHRPQARLMLEYLLMIM